MAAPRSPDELVPVRWTASTLYPDVWVDPHSDPRETGDELVGERTTVVEYLLAYRLTLRMKCGDLDATQLATHRSHRPRCRCSGSFAIWRRWSATGSDA